MTNDTYLTIRQFASKGVISENAIRTLVKQKKLPAVYIGTRAMLPYSRCVEALERMACGNHESS